VKSSLDEKYKLIQILKKKLKISATEHQQTIELVAHIKGKRRISTRGIGLQS
jgi:hypothetical protein